MPTSEKIVDAQTYELQGSGELDSETYLLAYLPSRLQPLSSVVAKEPDNIQLVGNTTALALKSSQSSSKRPVPIENPRPLEFLQEFTVCATFSVYSQLPLGTVVNYFTEPLEDILSIGEQFTRVVLMFL